MYSLYSVDVETSVLELRAHWKSYQ